ncbi:MAG TPA: DinB family protein [Bacteroidia bacterium]|nr:DinB family protein [Bacteroidia bacterium]
MKKYLVDTFTFNSTANKKLLNKIKQLPEKEECVKLFSHLINCQYKWMARVVQDPKAQELSWWEPLYDINELEKKWDDSLAPWINFINSKTENELSTEVTFIGFDGGLFAATPMDIAIQLNYHSIHHRAQMQTIIRKQGLEPDFLDYIGTKYRKL